MTDKSGSNDGERSSANGEVPHNPFGDTHLGRSLKEVMTQINEESDALQKGPGADEAAGAESQAGDVFDPSETRIEEALKQVVSSQGEPNTSENGTTPAGNSSPHSKEGAAATASAHGNSDAEISKAKSELETVLKRFAEAERRRCERELAEWKEQLKKAAAIAIKKQVDAARAKWNQSQSANHAKAVEHYKKLKVLAEKVARQKLQIQKAKKELEEKLKVADRLHDEFDEIRNVLGGQIGAINALDKNGDPTES